MNNDLMPVLTRAQAAVFDPCAGKVCYNTKKDAATAINSAMRRRHNRPNFLRSYWCRACEAHHITSKEDRYGS